MRHATRRILLLVPSLLGITLVVFFLGALAPGDPAREVYVQRYGESPSDSEALEDLRHELGLDAPVPVQFARWLTNVARGDLGISWRYGVPVAELLRQFVGATLALSLPGAALSVLIGSLLGLAGGLRRGSALDRGIALLGVVTSGVPAYLVAYLLIYGLAVQRQWLPALGTGGLTHMILPWLTIGLSGFQSQARLTRSVLADALGSPWVVTARAKGLRERTVLWRHALLTRLSPLLTGVGNTVAGALARSVVVEVVFGWPGLGRFVTDSVVFRDYPAIQGFALLFGSLILGVYLAVDLLSAWLDPRVRSETAVTAP